MRTILSDTQSDYKGFDQRFAVILPKGSRSHDRVSVFGVGIDNFRIAEGTISDKARFPPSAMASVGIPHNSSSRLGLREGTWPAALGRP